MADKAGEPAKAPLHATLNAPKVFKSGHMSAMKSMSLMNDLQGYVVSLEDQSAKYKSQVEALKEEKKDLLRQSRGTRKGPDHTDFSLLGGDDLPPKVRALMEDNRMLKDQTKKMKESEKTNERTITKQQNEIIKLQEKVESLDEMLKKCSRSPEAVQDAQKLQETIDEQAAKITDLEHRVTVISKSKESDSRRAKGTAAIHKKELEAKDAEMKELKSVIEAKDMENRKLALKNKDLSKKLEPMRKLVEMQRQREREDAEREAKFEEEMAMAQETAEPEVVVMFCVVVDERGGGGGGGGGDGGDALPEGTEEEEAAAVKIQARFKGGQARREVEGMKAAAGAGEEGAAPAKGGAAEGAGEELTPEEAAAKEAAEAAKKAEEDAATAIQANFRGHQARKEVEGMKADVEAKQAEEETELATAPAASPRKTPAPPKGGKPKGGAPNKSVKKK